MRARQVYIAADIFSNPNVTGASLPSQINMQINVRIAAHISQLPRCVRKYIIPGISRGSSRVFSHRRECFRGRGGGEGAQ